MKAATRKGLSHSHRPLQGLRARAIRVTHSRNCLIHASTRALAAEALASTPQVIGGDEALAGLRLGKEKNYVRQGYWKDRTNLTNAIANAEQVLGITKAEDWYSVTMADLKQIGFPSAATRTQLAELLVEKYPDHTWNNILLFRGKMAQQKRLEKAVTSLFPELEIKRNVRKEAELINPHTSQAMELDIYIPSLNLAFEYQEAHHYVSSGYTYNPMEFYLQRDSMKRELAKAKGITLVIVPCWWDGTKESLVATIQQVRPDLLRGVSSDDALPISQKIPTQFLEKNEPTVADIGVPTNACFFTMSNINPATWWMFEKYDGIRGFWNPKKGAFYSRNGNRYEFPREIVDTMPKDLFLDGEIWFGRDTFSEAQKISNRARVSLVDWTKFKYMVFDIPEDKGTYEDRFNQLVEYVSKHPNKYIEVAHMQECENMEHLEEFFQDVIDKGGEGVILRDPKCPYQPGRSPGYLKHKKFRDAEAKIIRYVEPLQWECELPNGVVFTAPAGTAEFVKRWAPQPGDIVSFKHHGFLFTSKKPKLPTIYRLRTDLTWDTVVNNFKEHKTLPSALPLRRANKYKPKGYWHKLENRQEFFNEFAEKLGFDPKDPENWKNITVVQLMNKMQSVGPLSLYQNSLKEALEKSFPELQFNFKDKRPNGYWKNIENRKEFFLKFAEKQGFDPMVASNWANVTKSQLRATNDGAPFHLFKGPLHLTLAATFPELRFDRSEIEQHPKGYWDHQENRRQFFTDFAAAMGFDPLNSQNWQSVTKSQKGSGVLASFGGSLDAALQSTFPELDLKFEAKKERSTTIGKRTAAPWLRSFFNI